MFAKTYVLREPVRLADVRQAVRRLNRIVADDALAEEQGPPDAIASWVRTADGSLFAQLGYDEAFDFHHLGIVFPATYPEDACDRLVRAHLQVRNRAELVAAAGRDSEVLAAAAIANRHDPAVELIELVAAALRSRSEADLERGLLAAGYLENQVLLPELRALAEDRTVNPRLADGARWLIGMLD